MATLISFLFNDHDLRYAWLTLFALFVISMFVALPPKFMNIKTLKIIYFIPLGALLMFRSLLRSRKTLKNFSATNHSIIIDPDLNNSEIKNDKSE